jgi:hypothetical protein
VHTCHYTACVYYDDCACNNSVNSNPMYAKFREFKMFIGADAWTAGVNGPNDLRAQVQH